MRARRVSRSWKELIDQPATMSSALHRMTSIAPAHAVWALYPFANELALRGAALIERIVQREPSLVPLSTGPFRNSVCVCVCVCVCVWERERERERKRLDPSVMWNLEMLLRVHIYIDSYNPYFPIPGSTVLSMSSYRQHDCLYLLISGMDRSVFPWPCMWA